MKKWIFIIIGIIAIGLGLMTNIYLNAMEPVKAAEKKAIRTAKEKASITEVEDFTLFHEDNAYSIVTGKNKKGEEVIVWMPQGNKDVIIKKEKDGLSKQEAVDEVLKQVSPKKITSVKLGMVKNIPVWEVYYESGNNLMNYFYVDFESGKILKKIQNL
ncbi:DUF5590 domain-containing protein [Bacillus sp. 03113]|uniref:cell wall elongation regulator TseB-like domain-containing protein n=1 Tax=Bacillus sp. 03113 TaxID=2578211 RepID=UPI001141899F|nr:DUF5590 domain-containing protein [Bacillus sp. 03113]